MLNLPRWQVIAIVVVTALAGLFALPNALPGSLLNHLPGWYTQSRINLGLDLRGGAHFLLGDGSVRFISENINFDSFVKLLTPQGGEPIGDF